MEINFIRTLISIIFFLFTNPSQTNSRIYNYACHVQLFTKESGQINFILQVLNEQVSSVGITLNSVNGYKKHI